MQNYFNHFVRFCIRAKRTKVYKTEIVIDPFAERMSLNAVEISILTEHLQNMIVLIRSEISHPPTYNNHDPLLFIFRSQTTLSAIPVASPPFSVTFDWRLWSRPRVKSNSKQIN